MNKKKKVPKSVFVELKQFVRSLPRIYKVGPTGEPLMSNHFVRGRLLDRRQIEGIKKSDKKFDPSAWYSFKDYQWEDAYNLLEKVYLKEGKEGVVEACKKWMERYEAQKQATTPPAIESADDKITTEP